LKAVFIAPKIAVEGFVVARGAVDLERYILIVADKQSDMESMRKLSLSRGAKASLSVIVWL
jgi:hypothetical protein